MYINNKMLSFVFHAGMKVTSTAEKIHDSRWSKCRVVDAIIVTFVTITKVELLKERKKTQLTKTYFSSCFEQR